MTRKIYASLLVLVIGLTAFVLTGRQKASASAAPAASYDLLNQLPASDFIIYVDTQRMLTDVFPSILASRPEVSERINADIERFKKDVGFDPRTLDALAVGLNFNASQRARDFDFALVARGHFDASATIDAGLTAATKKSRGELEKQTQVYEGRTISLLTPVKRAQETERGSSPEKEREPGNNTVVFVALDPNTIAFGNLKSVKATIDAAMGRGRVSDELVQLATKNPSAVASFGGKVAPEFHNFFHLGNKQAQDMAASIRQVSGAFSASGDAMEVNVNIRTEAAEEARQLGMALNALKLVARIGGRSRDASESKSLETVLKDLNIYTVDNEVQITLKANAQDLAPFVRHF